MQALDEYFVAAGATQQFRAAVIAVDDVITALNFLHDRDDVNAIWTTLFGFSAGATTALIVGFSLDDHGIARPPVAAVIDVSGGFYNSSIDSPFDDLSDSDPVLMVIHGTEDEVVPFAYASQIEGWADSAGLHLDFQPVVGESHSFDMFSNVATTGVVLFQRTVDFLYESIFVDLGKE